MLSITFIELSSTVLCMEEKVTNKTAFSILYFELYHLIFFIYFLFFFFFRKVINKTTFSILYFDL